MDEIRAKKYANWIVANKEKKGTPEFETVAKAYRLAKGTGEAVAQEVTPEEKPEETPSIGSQLYGAIPEIAKGFTRGLTVDPISGASSLAYNAARAADPSMARFEDTGFGKKLAKAQEYLAPDDNGLITQAASGLGSLLSFIPGGLAKGALKVASLVGQSTSLASEEARARADQATLEGKPVSAKQQLTSQLMAAPTGLLELIPAERLARPIKAIFSKVKIDDIEQYAPTIFNRIKSVVTTGSEEALQEASSNIIQDLIQQGIYDPNLKIGESALANAEMGGTVGALAQTAVDFVTRKRMTQKYNRLKQEEGEKKIAEQVQAIKDKQDAKDKETMERFGIDPKQLFLPAPPKQIEDDETETDAVMNPLGLISHGELTPELVKQINDQRKADGKEKLKNFSIEDLVDAQVPQQNIDSILTSKANFTGEKTTKQDVINVAEERNIDIRGDGFTDFLARTTGSRDLQGMTQPQLHAAFKSLSNMEKNESLTMLPTGTNAKRFTQEQYNKSVKDIKKLFPETGKLGRSEVIKETKQFSGLENDSDAESLLNTAVKNGEFALVKKPLFNVINKDGSVLRSYTKREDASKAALRDNLSVKDNLSVDVVIPESALDIQDIGLDIREGQFKQGVAPAAFEITTSDGVRIGTPHSSMEAAEKASNTIREFRLAESANFTKAADRALQSIDANNNSLLKMQSLGTVSEIDLLKASANITKNNRQLEANAKKLRAQAESYAQPLTIAPKGEKVISKKGFTYFENDAPVATFDSREQAEKSLLARRTDAELATIVEKATKKGGATANRIIGSVQQEMSNRAGTEPKGFRVTFKSPDTLKKEEKAEAKKRAEARLSGVGGAGVFTPELRVAAEQLSAKLRPLLDRLGLKDLRLNMVTSITTPSGDQADGEYSKALIKISLLAEDPMRTLNHEAIHALKELGAFTKDQWRVLSNKAKSEWIETYNIKARYSGLDAEGQIEEAIADAFSDFAIKPQPGMMGAIVAKIKSFFEALKNSMNDLGFQTYQDVFSDVATGNLSSYSGRATTLGDTVKYMNTYHGSPHRFPPTAKNPLGEFDPMKIGTGEGAQAYGTGAGYLAEAKDVANEYAAKLAKPELQFSGKPIKQLNVSQEAKDAAKHIESVAGSMQYGYQGSEAKKMFLRLPEKIQKELGDVELFDGGNLYKVDLPDDRIAKMLDWDKPLSEQPKNVQKAWKQYLSNKKPDGIFKNMDGSVENDATGKLIYEKLSEDAGDSAKASAKLKELGIPGIRYLDGGSRNTSAGELISVNKDASGWQAKIKKTPSGTVGDGYPMGSSFTTSKSYPTEQAARDWANSKISGGTSNFVVFDRADMTILERNGMTAEKATASDKKYSIKAPASAIGFYSPIEKAALNLSRSKGTGLSFLNDLKKGDSVTRDELTYTGIEDWLKSKENLTKQEVQDYIANNKVDVQEVVLDDRSSEFKTKHYKWQLPNGDKYTEILLTLPLPQKTLNELNAAIQNEKTLTDQTIALRSKMRADIPNSENAKTIEELIQEYTKLDRLRHKAEITTRELVNKIDENTYESNHWDEPNVLAHIRISHRIDANGKKTTLIEEIQSDWHQAGRKNGYRTADAEKQLSDIHKQRQILFGKKIEYEKLTDSVPYKEAELNSINEQLKQSAIIADKLLGTAPDAPFKEDWYKLALKRAIKEAVDNGSESISLTTGKRQIKRYSDSLRQSVDEINFRVFPPGTVGDTESVITAAKDGDRKFTGTVSAGKFNSGVARGKTIAEVFGKSIATKIQNHDPSQGEGVIKGDDLSIGGEGMKKYYDEIYPAFLNSFGKKYGVKVEDTEIDIGTPVVNYSPEKVRTLPITPKMSEDVRKGQRMFSITRRIDVDGVSRSTVNNKGQAIAATDEKLTNFWRWFGDSKVVDDEGNPIVMYHGTDAEFDIFDVKATKKNRGTNFEGVYTTPDKLEAETFGKNVIGLYVKSANPYSTGKSPVTKEMAAKYAKVLNFYPGYKDDNIRFIISYFKKSGVFKDIDGALKTDVVKAGGYDSYIDGPHVVVFSSDQVKPVSSKSDTKYSIRDRIPANIQADINRTTHAREEVGYPKRIMAAVTPEGFQKHLLRFRQSYINRYESIERLSKRVAERFGIDELLAHTSAAASALFSDRAAGVTASVLVNGVPVYRDGMTTVSDFDGKVKGLISILEPLAKRNDPFIYQAFQYYAGVKRGGRLEAEGRENLFTNKDGAAYAAALEREFPEFVDVLKEYQKFNNGLVQYMKDTGVISAKDADLWTKNWDYIPFYRQMEGERTSGPQLFQSISGVSKPKELKGGTAKVDDFLETVVRNTRAAVEAGMKNVAAQRVIRDVVRMDEGEKVRFNHPDASDIVSIKVNGVTEKYRVRDPLLVESLKSLDMPEIPGLALFSKPADLLRNLVTKDPGFILANLMRDSLSSYITSGTDMKPFIDTFKQFGNSLADSSPEVLALKKSGFFTGYEFSGDTQSSSEATLKELRKRTGTRTTAEKTFLPLTAMWGMLEKGSNASDLATRAEIYKRTLAETGNEAEALFRALEVMNFGRKGSSAGIRVLSAIIPFFNARIQGLDVLYRAGFGQGVMANREQAQKSFMIRAMTMFALSSMYWFMASDDEEYEKASQETKDNNWIIEGFKIPIPFELGVIFKVIPERLLAYYFGNDTGEDLKDAMIRNLTSTMQVNLPQAILPVVETMANYSFFTGEPIVGMGTEGLEEKYQYTASTSTLAKKIGEKAASFRGAFGLPILPESPQLIDNLIKGYTGTLGTYAVMAIDSILTNEGEPVKATLKFEQLPVFKRFLASKDAAGTVSSYYDLKEEVEKAVQTMNMLERTGDYEGMKEYFKGEKGNLIAIRPYINALDKNISELRDLKRMIQSSGMSGDRKRDTLTSITRAENSITARIQDIKKFVYK